MNMKKIAGLLLALWMAALSGCSAAGLFGGGEVDTAGRSIQSTGDHSEAEIIAAMDEATRYFARHFDGCTLLDLRYDGEDSRKEEAAWADEYGGAVIVLKSDFRSGEKTEGSLGPNELYRNWGWILVKSAGGWELVNNGYG